MAFRLERRELLLAAVFAGLGFVLSGRSWLLFLAGLSPLAGLGVYYVIVYGFFFWASRFGLVLFDVRVRRLSQVLGLVLIFFAFAVVVDWESPYVNEVTVGSVVGVSPVYFQSEDGAAWFVWQSVLPGVGLGGLRLLVYVLTPFLVAVLGGFLLEGRVPFGL